MVHTQINSLKITKMENIKALGSYYTMVIVHAFVRLLGNKKLKLSTIRINIFTTLLINQIAINNIKRVLIINIGNKKKPWERG